MSQGTPSAVYDGGRVQGAAPRRGMVAADAVNVSRQVRRAVVAVRGMLGGQPFEVTRSRTASKSALFFCSLLWLPMLLLVLTVLQLLLELS